MEFRVRLLATTMALGFLGLVPNQARADLIGGTVQAFYYNGTLVGPAGLLPDGAATSDPIAVTAAGVTFTNNVSQTDIGVSATQIVLTNQVRVRFVSQARQGAPAPTRSTDSTLSSPVKTSSACLSIPPRPLPSCRLRHFQGNTHLGLQLISNNEIRVDVTGDLPRLNDHLSSTSRSRQPHPSRVRSSVLAYPGLLLASGGLLGWWRRKQKAEAAA